MPLKTELLIAVWVVAGLFAIYIGAMTLKFPDAAWERAMENARRRGLTAKRTARWDRSRVFTGALTICIGALLLGLSGWVALQQRTDANATQPISYVDPATGKYVTRDLTPEEAKQLRTDPNGFMTRIAPALEKKH